MIVWLSYLVRVAAGAPCHVTLPTDQLSMGLAACQLAGEIGIPEWPAQSRRHVRRQGALLDRHQAAGGG